MLLDQGLQQYHIRKPGFSDFDMINYITSIPKAYHKNLVLHSHYFLAKDFGFKGIQVGVKRVAEAKEYLNSFNYVGYSAHSFDEIIANKGSYTHFFLSPVFNSISKKDYTSNFNLNEVSSFLQQNKEIKIIALGGIDNENCRSCIEYGFSGIALLGSIWNENDLLIAYNTIFETLNQRAFTMSIAGFDPCSGAGLTADIKTFEQHEVQGLGVVSAITYQNESEFKSVDWLSFEQIKKQIEILLSKYRIGFVKIGLIESLEVLKQVTALLKGYDSNIKIIWDPILKSSTNFDFHNDIDKASVLTLLKDMYLITPNLPECEKLFGSSNVSEIQTIIKNNGICNVLIKGGHSINDDVTDVLTEANNVANFNGKRLVNKDKHGTGCVLSSAICSNLSKGVSLHNSIEQAKLYVTRFIDSNATLLGYHKN